MMEYIESVTEIAQIVEAIQKAYNDNKQAGIYDELATVLNSIWTWK